VHRGQLGEMLPLADPPLPPLRRAESLLPRAPPEALTLQSTLTQQYSWLLPPSLSRN